MSKDLRAAATAIYKSCDNLDQATEELYQFLEKKENQELASELYEDAKYRAARAYLSAIVQQVRSEIRLNNTSTATPAATPEGGVRTSTLPTPLKVETGFVMPDGSRGAKLLQSAIEDNLLNYPLPGKKNILMRNATFSDLDKLSAEVTKRARTMATDGVWFSKIKDKISGTDKTVGEVLSHDELKMMRLDAEAQQMFTA